MILINTYEIKCLPSGGNENNLLLLPLPLFQRPKMQTYLKGFSFLNLLASMDSHFKRKFLKDGG